MLPIDQKDWETCLEVLQIVSEDPSRADDQDRFKSLVAKIYKQARRQRRVSKKNQTRKTDQLLLENTERMKMEPRSQALIAEPMTPSHNPQRLHFPARCYVCKNLYKDVDSFYHLLCPPCAKENHLKRRQRTHLNGHIALVTGGRVKIGYEVVLKLLRDGARVIATTRFPVNAIQRIAQEKDFDSFKDRLLFYRLDLRHIASVEAFTDFLIQTEPHLDILINNAAQTIRHPDVLYEPLYAQEQQAERLLAEGLQKLSIQEIPTLPFNGNDSLEELEDFRSWNSWVETLETVSTLELVETQVVNSIAPFLLTSRLTPLLERSPNSKRFIINVSAMEGQFGRESKTHRHPHTNMAKAALNMLTRTSAQEYARKGIFMNSVDTGWVTQENPYPRRLKIRDKGFVPPLDVVDGAARIYDPIVQGLQGNVFYGHFLKNYHPFEW